MKGTRFFTNLSGVLLALTLAISAIFVGHWLGFSVILLALVAGIALGNAVSLPEKLSAGLKFSSGTFLEFAIVFMAFSVDYSSFLKLGWESILLVLVTMLVVLWGTTWLGKRMNCPSSAGLLVGFGTAICGSTAIAALAPSVSTDKSDMGIAMAVVNFYGLLGMLVIPFITADWLTDVQNSILLGASLHSVGNVAGAGFAINETIGEMAVTVKLGRVALLTPALLIFSHFIQKKDAETENQIKNKLRLPWYLIVFLVLSILVSLVKFPSEILLTSKHISNFLLATAMASIGLKVRFRTLLTSGKKGLIFGGVLFAVQLAIIMGLLIVMQL